MNQNQNRLIGRSKTITDAEKIEMLERENKLLKEQIELLKEINSLKGSGIIQKITLPSDQPYWTYATTQLANANEC